MSSTPPPPVLASGRHVASILLESAIGSRLVRLVRRCYEGVIVLLSYRCKISIDSPTKGMPCNIYQWSTLTWGGCCDIFQADQLGVGDSAVS